MSRYSLPIVLQSTLVAFLPSNSTFIAIVEWYTSRLGLFNAGLRYAVSELSRMHHRVYRPQAPAASNELAVDKSRNRFHPQTN